MAPESIGFIGECWDLDTNLLYLNARWYDPVLGRFLTPHWWGPTIPGVGTNRYAYADNDPINASDRNGHWFGIDDLFGAVLGGRALMVWSSSGMASSVGAENVDGARV